MAIIGLITKNNILVYDYFRKVILKSKEGSLVKNPFSIKTYFKVKKEELFFLMDLEPLYPPVFWFGLILLIPFFIFKWFNFWLILPFVFLGLGFFWSSTFYIIILKAGLKRKGYKDKITVLKKSDIIRRLADWGK